ncbi:MAG: enoyl-CoA hydratase/isomerase family protein [Pseudomonadota bacterium]
MSHSINTDWPHAHVARLTFTDVERANQLCWAAVNDIAAGLRACREQGARVVVLASGLAGHWLQHAWLHDLINGVTGDAQTGNGAGWFELLAELAHEEVISVAAISGDASGGGAEIGWACDLRVAERQVCFCQPEIAMGLSTGIGGTARLARLIGRSAATLMTLTGEAQSAQRLWQWGAIAALAEPGDAGAVAVSLAARIARHSPAALRAEKRVLAHSEEAGLADSLRAEQDAFQAVVGTSEALAAMRAVQAEYDAGLSEREVHGYDAQ